MTTQKDKIIELFCLLPLRAVPIVVKKEVLTVGLARVYFSEIIQKILPELRKEEKNFWKNYVFKEHNPDALIENFLDYLQEKYASK